MVARRSVFVLLLFSLLLCAIRLPAQSGVASAPGGDPKPLPGTYVITLGNSAAELTGPWRFHVGDDLQWALPEFDDSNWELVDLTPPTDSADPDLGTSGLLPGWTTTGHAGHSGYAWYRLQVDVGGNAAGTRLALKMPDAFDDAYQVYVNGQPIGQFGRFAQHHVTTFTALPGGFKLPTDLRSGPMTIAIRMWMDSTTPYLSPDAGGLHGPPVLGHAHTVASQVRLAWDDVDRAVGVGFLEMIVLLLALAVALTHFWMDRKDKAYLWLGLVALTTLLGNVLVLLGSYTTVLSQDAYVILSDVGVAPIRIGLWVLFWAYWFRLGPAVWLQRTVWICVFCLAASTLPMRPPFHGTIVPMRTAQYFAPIVLITKLALAALLAWVVARGIRKREAEGWLALPAVCLAAMANYQHELRLIHVRTAFSVFGYSISLGVASTMLSLLLVTLMLSRRFLHAERRKVQWGWEIEQARQVQQVLIPKELPEVPGLRIESDYRPAREVGGRLFSDCAGRERWQRSSGRWRCDRQGSVRGHDGCAHCGDREHGGARECGPGSDADTVERLPVRAGACDGDLPGAAHRPRRRRDAGECGASAAISQRAGGRDGRSFAAGRDDGRRVSGLAIQPARG